MYSFVNGKPIASVPTGTNPRFVPYGDLTATPASSDIVQPKDGSDKGCCLIQYEDYSGDTNRDSYRVLNDHVTYTTDGTISHVAPALLQNIGNLVQAGRSDGSSPDAILWRGAPPTATVHGSPQDILRRNLVKGKGLKKYNIKLCEHPRHIELCGPRTPVSTADQTLPLQVWGGVLCLECTARSNSRLIPPNSADIGRGYVAVTPLIDRSEGTLVGPSLEWLTTWKEQRIVAGMLGKPISEAVKIIRRPCEAVVAGCVGETKAQLRWAAMVGGRGTTAMRRTKGSDKPTREKRSITFISKSCEGGPNALWRNGVAVASKDVLVPTRGPRESIMSKNGGCMYRLIGTTPCIVLEEAALRCVKHLFATKSEVCLTICLTCDCAEPVDGAFDCTRDVGAVGRIVTGAHEICWAQVCDAMENKNGAILCGSLRLSLCAEKSLGVFATLVEMAMDAGIGSVVLSGSYGDLLPASVQPGDINTAKLTESYLRGGELSAFGGLVVRCPLSAIVQAIGV